MGRQIPFSEKRTSAENGCIGPKTCRYHSLETNYDTGQPKPFFRTNTEEEEEVMVVGEVEKEVAGGGGRRRRSRGEGRRRRGADGRGRRRKTRRKDFHYMPLHINIYAFYGGRENHPQFLFFFFWTKKCPFR